jgi:SAM-dependent methyltransferase
MAMNESYENIRSKIRELYEKSAREQGDSPLGVGWKDQESHNLRLKILSEVGISNGCSILDVGCGYGALLKYLMNKGVAGIKYTGIDIVEPLIEMANKRFGGSAEFRVADIMDMTQEYDFVVNLGIFNVKLSCGDTEFLENFVSPIILRMWKLARIGLSVSFMTDMVDYRNANLYYASPSRTFDFLRNLSRYVVLRHDYGLYEFTVYVYKRGIA